MIKKQLNITLLQSSLFWEDRDQNLAHLGKLIDSIEGETDIILLPEMFSSGFSMNTESDRGDRMEGPSMQWMRSKAAEKNAVICGSLKMNIEGQFMNRFIWMQPDGSFQHYDKKHLFSMAEEDKYFTPGNDRLILEYKGWKICPLICYDLRFPVWARNIKKGDDYAYDLLLYTANWPMARRNAWMNLLKARATENQSYVAGVNRVGRDGKGIEYSGDSLIIDSYGEVLSGGEAGEEMMLRADLDLEKMYEFRAKFPILDDADKFEIR